MRYEDAVEARLRGALAAAGGGTVAFQDLCRACAGAFPIDVRAALDATVRRGGGTPVALATPAGATREVYDDAFPEPHPADYEWRFTPAGARALAEAARPAAAHARGGVACLGTPTVYLELRRAGVHATLIDRNPFLVDAFPSWAADGVVEADLNGPAGPRADRRWGPASFGAAVVDPPWYPAHTRAWLATAARAVRPGGLVLCTLFPALVRPAAAAERDDLLAFAAGMGEVELSPAAVEYDTPTFEAETLAGAGLVGLPRWRLGDLLRLRVDRPPAATPGESSPAEPAWTRTRFGRQIVAVRDASGTAGDAGRITARPPYADGTCLLRSVSARDTVRRDVTLWTSRNRGLVVTGTARVSAVLGALAAGTTDVAAALTASRDAEERAALERIIALLGL